MLDNFLKIISRVNRTLLTCTYVLSIGVLRTRGRFALHVLKGENQSSLGLQRKVVLDDNSLRAYHAYGDCLPVLTTDNGLQMTDFGFWTTVERGNTHIRRRK